MRQVCDMGFTVSDFVPSNVRLVCELGSEEWDPVFNALRLVSVL